MASSVASDLDRFLDFATATRQKLFSSPDELISQASKYRTTLYRDMIRGLTTDKMIQSGTEIVDYVQLAYSSTYSHFNPTDDFGYTETNSLTQVRVPWRFAKVYSVVNEFELDLQQGGEEVVFKRVKKAKEAERQLSWFEGQETDLWGQPDVTLMESSGTLGSEAGKPLSIPAFITRNGGAPTSTNTDARGITGANWTTVMGVNPTTFPNWKNQVSTFNNASDATRRADNTGVISAMDDVFLSCTWEAPDKMESYMTDTRMNKMKVVCNRPSYKLLVSLATSKNNILTPRNDLGYQMGQVIYHNIPIKYVAILDDLDYDDTTAHVQGVANAADGTGKFGYAWRFINFNWFKPIYNSKHFRRVTNWDGGAKNPFSRVLLEDTMFNLWCMNRREQGIVCAA